MKKLLIQTVMVSGVCAVLALMPTAVKPTKATGTTYTVAGVTYSAVSPRMTVCRNCVQSRTGWQGAPQLVGIPVRVTLPNGNSVFVIRARGLVGASITSVDRNATAVVLATDDWRKMNTTYDRASDTIMTMTGRRQGTPATGVIAIMAPTVEGQGANPPGSGDPIIASIHIPGYGEWPVQITDYSWKADTGTIDYLDGTRVSVSAEPGRSDAIAATGVKWGPSVALTGPNVTSETTLQNIPFEVTVDGYLEDMTTGGLLGFPNYRLGPGGTVVLPLMEGRTYRKRMTVSYGRDTATLENSYTSLTYTPAPGVTIVDPPPTPHILRSVIMIIPGDMRYLPDGGAE